VHDEACKLEMNLVFLSFFAINILTCSNLYFILLQMPQTARPFMGPNLYISPGGGFTHLVSSENQKFRAFVSVTQH